MAGPRMPLVGWMESPSGTFGTGGLIPVGETLMPA